MKWWCEMTWTPRIPSLVFVIRRSCLKGRLSQCCGPYLRLSVLSLPQRESWGRSSHWRFWRHRCSTTSQQVGRSVCEREHMRVRACTPPVRDFTINHILCDFACPVLPFMIVLRPFSCLCNGEVTFGSHSYGLCNWQVRSVCRSSQCFLINQTNAVIIGWQLCCYLKMVKGFLRDILFYVSLKSSSAVGGKHVAWFLQ